MHSFRWKNRTFCIYRIQVLVTCKQLPIEDAIQETLYFAHERSSSYAYCYHPEDIPAAELQRLKRDAAAYIDRCKSYQTASSNQCIQMEMNLVPVGGEAND